MIRLALRQRPPLRLEMDGLVPEALAGLGAADIARLPLGAGKHAATVGDWFDVETGGDDAARLVIAGGDRLDRIGAGMSGGEIVVESDAGAYAGIGMRGGMLRIHGSAGHGAATAMSGGELRIAGDAGDAVGGALPGEGMGMRDGLVVVGGSAGSHVGDRMRRGVILVAGAAGPFCGARLWAGTIVTGSTIGRHPGIGMRRGTIVSLASDPTIAPSFVDSGVHELVFGRLLAHALAGTPLEPHAARLARLRRWAGDLAVGGRGEILAPA